MATLASAPRGAVSYAASQSFFTRMAWVLAAVIVIGFAQNAALGRVNLAEVPRSVHLHGLLMLGWLGLLITQNRLAAQGKLTRHRQLGRIGALLVCVIAVLTAYVAASALVWHRFPPFFDPAYFLAMTWIGAGTFVALVLAGVARRRDTEAHRRLITVATIVLLDPALGRLLPMPLIGGERGEWITMLIQLGFVTAIALHDRRTLHRLHPATLAGGLVIVLAHVVISIAARTGPVDMFAQRLMAHQLY